MRHQEPHSILVSRQEGKERLEIQLAAQLDCHLSALLHPVSLAAFSWLVNCRVMGQQCFVRQLQSAQACQRSAGVDFKCQLSRNHDLPCFTS